MTASREALARFRGVYQEAGLINLNWRMFSYAYKHVVRPVLPVVGRRKLAGIEVGVERRLGDNWITPKLYNPPDAGDQENYEEKLISALKMHVRPSDSVTVVGGGLGVTAAMAATIADCGTVTCFEGDLRGAEKVRETAKINGVADRVTTHHAIVACNIGVYGDSAADRMIAPEDLPPADVLELDCEGAELPIIVGIVHLPRVIICETHGFLGATSVDVNSALLSRGYIVEDLGWAEPRLLEVCQKNDIRVLVGTRPPPNTRPVRQVS